MEVNLINSATVLTHALSREQRVALVPVKMQATVEKILTMEIYPNLLTATELDGTEIAANYITPKQVAYESLSERTNTFIDGFVAMLLVDFALQGTNVKFWADVTVKTGDATSFQKLVNGFATPILLDLVQELDAMSVEPDLDKFVDQLNTRYKADEVNPGIVTTINLVMGNVLAGQFKKEALPIAIPNLVKQLRSQYGITS